MARKACSRPRLVTSISRGRYPASRIAYSVASESLDWIWHHVVPDLEVH